MFNVFVRKQKKKDKENFRLYLFALIVSYISTFGENTIQTSAEPLVTARFLNRFFQRERNDDDGDDDDDSDSDDEDLRIIGMEGFIPLRTLQPEKRSTKNDPAAKDKFSFG